MESLSWEMYAKGCFALSMYLMEILMNTSKVQEHWSHKLEISQKEMQLEQIRACTELGQRCLKFNPEERPYALRWPTFRSRTLGPKTMARILKTLTQAITKFYARDTEDMSLEELYRGVSNIVLHGKKGEELYSTVETAMASEVRSLCSPLDDAAPVDSAFFLQELLTKWDRHITALRMTCDVFSYMDRMYIPDSQ
ncbi:cullin-3B-like [Miscanthus floridulus]|uniref:cullin-3B-like n=1 Tax=Miscanthus floridulus TaxID=154761 RepID=UPI00345A1211